MSLGHVDLRPREPPASLGRVRLEDRWFDVLAHRTNDAVLVEFEAGAAEAGTEAPIYSLACSFLPRLEEAHSLETLSQLAAQEIKRLTGFGRALVCRFSEEGHGIVQAEALDEGYDSYLHHCFPPSDIPAQARELYLKVVLRLDAATAVIDGDEARTAGSARTCR